MKDRQKNKMYIDRQRDRQTKWFVGQLQHYKTFLPCLS